MDTDFFPVVFLNNGTERCLVLCVISSLMGVKEGGKFFRAHAMNGYGGMEVQIRLFLS